MAITAIVKAGKKVAKAATKKKKTSVRAGRVERQVFGSDSTKDKKKPAKKKIKTPVPPAKKTSTKKGPNKLRSPSSLKKELGLISGGQGNRERKKK